MDNEYLNILLAHIKVELFNRFVGSNVNFNWFSMSEPVETHNNIVYHCSIQKTNVVMSEIFQEPDILVSRLLTNSNILDSTLNQLYDYVISTINNLPIDFD